MKIDSLLEIIEPTVKNKKWRGNFDSTKMFKGNKDKNLGSGNFSTVDSIPNDPHMVKKTSNLPEEQPDDAYWSYVTEIVNNKLWENPYFPRIYNITKIQDKEGKIMYRGKIEKLVELHDAINNLDDLNSLSRKIVGQELDEEKYSNRRIEILNEYFAEFIEKYVKLGEPTGIFRDYSEQDFDSSFKEACKTLRELGKKHGWKIDIHQWNIMVRRGPHGLQLVFSDPFSFKS